MLQIGCETCLKLQKAYSEALRRYADAMQFHTERITQGDYTLAASSHSAIHEAETLCATHRRVLEHHEATEHKKKVVGR